MPVSFIGGKPRIINSGSGTGGGTGTGNGYSTLSDITFSQAFVSGDVISSTGDTQRPVVAEFAL